MTADERKTAVASWGPGFGPETADDPRRHSPAVAHALAAELVLNNRQLSDGEKRAALAALDATYDALKAPELSFSGWDAGWPPRLRRAVLLAVLVLALLVAFDAAVLAVLIARA